MLTPWTRLANIVKRRLRLMGLTQAALQAKGGPSVSWMTKLSTHEGPPSRRQEWMLQELDHGLNWPKGTAHAYLTADRDGWSEDQWAEEDERLVHLADKISNAAWLVEQRLRAMPEGDVDDMVRSIFRVMGMPVRE